MSCTIYQEGGKNRTKTARILAENLEKGLEMLYNGIENQDRNGKRWLKLSKGSAVWVEGMDKSGYLTHTKIAPANWTRAQMLNALRTLGVKK